ncbi:phage head closure protein [Micromonospora sp. NPDC048999]|uniref:phage head closure protein n=1 Tax=Micromonospora sp. NPDC048999 TaxID=3155391 RepID=UPI0033C4AF1E
MIPIGVHELPRHLQVWRPTSTGDGAGGQVVTRTQVDTVRAKVSQPSAEERTAAGQSGAQLDAVVHLQPTADVRRGDELRGDGETYRVWATVHPSEPVYLRAQCERTQSEGT